MKYNNRITEVDGIKFHSNKEAEYYKILKLRKQIGEIKDFQRQIKFNLVSNGLKVGTYTIDFKIIHNDDTIEFIEVKGMSTESWILKWNILMSMLNIEINNSFTIAGVEKMIEKLKRSRNLIKPTNWFYF